MKITLIACGLALSACGVDDGEREDRRLFIQKASHALHPSAAPMTADEVEALVDHDPDAIVAELYADPRTRDAVFRVSLAFLGAPVDELHADGAWAAPPFQYSPAVTSARTFRDGGDPLAPLFTTHAVTPTGVVQLVDPYYLDAYYPGTTLAGTTAERRAIAAKAILDDIAAFRAFAAIEPFDRNAVCDRYVNGNLSFVAFIAPTILGVPAPIVASANPYELSDADAFPFDDACFGGGGLVRDTALAKLDRMTALYRGFFDRMEPILARWEQDPESAFVPVDFAAIEFASYDTQEIYGRPGFYPQFWQLAPNSSTNYDRKRGAYVLDRFFCDDLKPVGAALPTAHVEGKHASDPACAACHFKLDPMAGYFRRIGFFGTEFDDETLRLTAGEIQFDDFATTNFLAYQNAWLAPEGSGRQFDVGYIRSTRDPSLNTYGDGLADLDQLLRTAPEVERCFVQRLFEYFNGTDQAVDPGFLDDVAADLHDRGADRLERGIARILTGKTFRTPDRNSTICYDLAPGADPAHRPPCEVAAILRTHCASCHSGGAAQSGLDVTRWTKADDGGYGFGQVGVPDRVETFTRMLDRVTTSDLARQMPQAKDMPLHAREQLALWLQAEIEAGGR